MYSILLFLHSLFRWLVLSSLIYAILRAYRGFRSNGGDWSNGGDRSDEGFRSDGRFRSDGATRSGRPFTKADDAIRHWTATIAHIQLTIGCVLYFTSPLIKLFFADFKGALAHPELSFFGMVHVSLMILSIVIITIGSALAKRATADADKFKIQFRWFSIALLLIFIAIPWPFSILAGRPLFRTF